MGIRIEMETEGPVVVLHVAGQIAGPGITQLRDACERVEGNVVLDLSAMMFADNNGVELLRTLRKEGAAIRGASPFIKLLIDGVIGTN